MEQPIVNFEEPEAIPSSKPALTTTDIGSHLATDKCCLLMPLNQSVYLFGVSKSKNNCKKKFTPQKIGSHQKYLNSKFVLFRRFIYFVDYFCICQFCIVIQLFQL